MQELMVKERMDRTGGGPSLAFSKINSWDPKIILI